MSLMRRRVSAGVSSCVECRVGSMGPLIWQILCGRRCRGEMRRLIKQATKSCGVRPASRRSTLTRSRAFAGTTEFFGLYAQFFIAKGGSSTNGGRLSRSSSVVFLT
jgi:hypothetical protein